MIFSDHKVITFLTVIKVFISFYGVGWKNCPMQTFQQKMEAMWVIFSVSHCLHS